MAIWEAIGLIVGILVFIIALCAGAIWVEKRFPGQEYDERQKIAKGRGYRLGFWFGIAYYLGVSLILLWQVDGERTVEPYLLVFAGIMLQGIVDHTYCLLTHSALPLSQNRLYAVSGYVVCGALHSTQFYISSKRDGLSLVGHGSATWIWLIGGCCFFYLTLLHVIQALRERKE